MGLAIDGIILAAGLSSRAGQFKMAMMLGDKSLIEHTIAGMAPAVNRIIVVGGHKIELIREILEGQPGVDIVYNESYHEGMFSSVKEGLRRVTGNRFFLLPGDHPLVKTQTYRMMLEVDSDIVIPAYRGRRGHPVLMSSHLVEPILKEPDTATLRDCIRQIGFVTVETGDEGVILDVDDLNDYHAVKQVYEHEH